MIGFKTTLLQFGKQGEKTGWTYISIPQKLAEKIKPSCKKSFRVKGKIDAHTIKSVALLPMGDGHFILPVNAVMRKAIRKEKGASVVIEMQEDTAVAELSAALVTCLEDDPAAKAYFNTLPPSHRQYYSKWIESAKTDSTKTKRIAISMTAFANKLSYAQMMQLNREL